MNVRGLQSHQTEIKARVLADRLGLLYQHLITSVPIAFLCATLIAISLYGVIPNQILLAWCIATVFIFALRLFFLKLYRLSPHRTKLHLRLFLLGVFLTACIWGVAGTVLMPANDFLHQTVIIVIIAGVSSGGIQTLQASLAACYIYIIVSVLPLDIWLFMQNIQVYYILASAILLFIFFMLVTSKRGFRLIMQSYHLQYENKYINLELEDANRLLKANLDQREELDKLKNEFISVVSHELRTPLTSIKGSLGLLVSMSKDKLDEKMQRLLEISHNNCERLIRLINDILDIEKIETGKLEFKFKNISLNKLLFNAIEENRSYAKKYHVNLELIHQKDVIVFADEDRLNQVITNLLSNAIKFSHPNGEVLVKTNIQDSVIRISVIDHGMGIPDEFRAKIFGKFAQADTASTRLKSGTGLGLSISKAILERHASKIHFASEVGKGTTFYFDLPIVKINNTAPLELS